MDEVSVKRVVSLDARSPGAPALEKGLDVLEALAGEREGLSQKALAERVGRTVGEVFRVLGVLERRGYIERDAAGAYGLTLRLFELAQRHPPARRLQAAALPVMDALSRTTRLSCHLVVRHGDRMMVVAQSDPDLAMGWSVRLGAVFPLSEHFVSARILAAFAPPARRERMAEIMALQERASPRAAIDRRLVEIARRGHDVRESDHTRGIVDASYPILDQWGYAAAALTVAFLPQAGITPDLPFVVRTLAQAARDLTSAIGGTAATSAEPVARIDA